MCAVLLPPGVTPIAVNKYIINLDAVFSIMLFTSCVKGKNFLRSSGYALPLCVHKVKEYKYAVQSHVVPI